jgi:prepilin-type N-terminal cleavage/methylation domain-containing protein
MRKIETNSKFQIRRQRIPSRRGFTHLPDSAGSEWCVPPSRFTFHVSRFTHRASRIRRAPRVFGCSRAFSLIEVMIALLILGVALVGFVQATTTAVSSSKESEIQTTAALLASGRIEKLQADGDLEDGDSNGDWGDDFPNYSYTQTISPTDVRGLHEVRVTIENPNTGKQLYELRTMLFEIPPATEEDTSSKSKQKKRKDTQ